MPLKVFLLGVAFLLLGIYLELLTYSWMIIGCAGLVVLGMGIYFGKEDLSNVPNPEHIHEREQIDFQKLLDSFSEEFREVGNKPQKGLE